MASSTLRRRLVHNLKEDLKSNLLFQSPLRAGKYFLDHGRNTPIRDLAFHVGQSSLELAAYSVIHNLSEFSLLSVLPPNPTFKRRLVIQAGTRFTASVLAAAFFKEPFSANTYLIYPILSQLFAVFQLIIVEEAEGDAFVGECAPALLPLLKKMRNLSSGYF
jgi:hypothetical protein